MSLRLNGVEEFKGRLLELAKKSDALVPALQAITVDGVTEMQGIVQVRSGVTRDKIVQSNLVNGGRIHSGSPISQILEYGSAPHIILPRNAKMLHWVDAGGKDVFAFKVKHPGTRPYPFFHPVRYAVNVRALEAMREVFK